MKSFNTKIVNIETTKPHTAHEKDKSKSFEVSVVNYKGR